MNPQKSEKEKHTGRSQKGFERGRRQPSNDPRGGERPAHQGQPTKPAESTEHEFEDDE